MGPVEGFFLSLAFIVTLIGLARGYRRELGNTVVFMSTILLYAFVYQYGAGTIERIGEVFAPGAADTLLSFVLTAIFVSIIFASYAGRTFDFSGRENPPPGGTIIALLVGLTNGYLIAGTLWFIQAIFDYPIQRFFAWFVPTNPLPATTLIEAGEALYWPPVLFPSPVFWAIPIVILLILRVRG
jgi:hypothetical protein